MKVAVPDWQGRVSPVFDVAGQVLLVDLDDRQTSGRRESLGSTAPHDRVQRLADLGVEVLVCGAISWPLEVLLAAGGIRVISQVCGEVEEVVQALRDGAIEDQQFAMPGFSRKGQNRRHRRRGGGLTTGSTS